MVNRSLAVLLIVLLLGMAPGGLPAAAQGQPSRQFDEGSASGLIVFLKEPGTPSAARLVELSAAFSASTGLALFDARPMSGGAYVFNFERELPLAEAAAAANRLALNPAVRSAEPDLRVYPTLIPNDTLFPQMWHLQPTAADIYGVDAPAAWDFTTGDPNLVVAVLDTGILKLHPDLVGRFVSGYDFITDLFIANDGNGRDADAADAGDWVTQDDLLVSEACGVSPKPSSWHGSHVAGTIGAAAHNGQGIAGLNWQSKILPVRVLGKCGGVTSDILDAIRWSAGLPVMGVPVNPNPAKVINMSLGGRSPAGCSPAYQAVINEVNAAGAIVVVAAGNSNDDASQYVPASCDGVITVGATEMGGKRSGYSNFGTTLEISAPGGDAAVTYPGKPDNLVFSTISSSPTTSDMGDYIIDGYQGTSMATPHVAGIVSLMLSVNPNLVYSEVLQILQNTATPFAPGSPCLVNNLCGAGIAHAGRAVAEAFSSQVIASPTTSRPGYGGLPNNPVELEITLRSLAGVEEVSVGGIAAEILSVVPGASQQVVTVMPPQQPGLGLYDLGVTLDGTTYTSTQAVVYGVYPQDDAFDVDQNSPAAVLDVLANDLNAAEMGAAVHSVSPASHGTASLVGGQVRYQPNPNYFGPDSFTYAVQNGSSLISARVAINVVQTTRFMYLSFLSYSDPNAFFGKTSKDKEVTFRSNTARTEWSIFELTIPLNSVCGSGTLKLIFDGPGSIQNGSFLIRNQAQTIQFTGVLDGPTAAHGDYLVQNYLLNTGSCTDTINDSGTWTATTR